MGYECHIRDEMTGAFYELPYFQGPAGKDFDFTTLTDTQKAEIKAEITATQLAEITPQIGSDGNWMVNGVNTGVPARADLSELSDDAAAQKTARDNLGMFVELASGLSWSSGSVSVPNSSYYNIFIVKSGNINMICVKIGSLIRGGNLTPYISGGFTYSYAFSATFSDETWTLQQALSMSHTSAGSHGTEKTLTIDSIIGIL